MLSQIIAITLSQHVLAGSQTIIANPSVKWLGGAQLSTPNYGTMGVATSSNWPPARTLSAATADSNGAIWIYGGIGDGNSTSTDTGSCNMNDLWMFSPSTGLWTWAAGTGDCVDFSTDEGPTGSFNVTASGSRPSARQGHAMWADPSGNIYMFGGASLYSNNDLWKYSTSAGTWTWIQGNSSLSDTPSIASYGVLGVANSSNVPGGRTRFASCVSSKNPLVVYVFGGQGYDINGDFGYLSDLWTFDMSANVWTWVSGNSTVNAMPSFVGLNTEDPSNAPAARRDHSCWSDDNTGDIYIYGGTLYTEN
eukprot:jgi/Hompol1/437/HPOL_002496-RA